MSLRPIPDKAIELLKQVDSLTTDVGRNGKQYYFMTEVDLEYNLQKREWAGFWVTLFQGLYFGYPLCCIIFFLYRDTWSDEKIERHYQERKPTMVGYIQCDWCYKKYIESA